MLNYQVIPVTDFQENCSIIWCDKTMEGALIDPGGEPELLKKAVEKLGVKINKILITHGHLDHVGAVEELANYYQVDVLGSSIEDKMLFDMLPEQCLQFGFPYIKPFLPTRWLKEGDKITIGEQTLDVLHCPGHAPGHIVFIDKPDNLAFVGDVIFKNSIGRTDLPGSNHGDLIASIKQKLFALDDDMVFIPGHGPRSTIGYEKTTNPYLR